MQPNHEIYGQTIDLRSSSLNPISVEGLAVWLTSVDVHLTGPADIGSPLNRRADLFCSEHINTGFGRLADAA